MRLNFLFLLIAKLFFFHNIIDCQCDPETDGETLTRRKRAILNVREWQWKQFPIKYEIGKNVSVHKIEDAINLIQKETCLTFKKVEKLETEGLLFLNGYNCTTEIGKRYGSKPHKIFMPKYCQESYAVERLIMHALGAILETSRPDRDKYIEFIENNTKTELLKYIDIVPKCAVNTYGMAYDYKSVLHVGPYFYSKKPGPFFMSKQRLHQNQIGYVMHMSFNDIKSLNMHFCRKKCLKKKCRKGKCQMKNKINCKNYGYPDSKNCKQCRCLKFFNGTKCETFRHEIAPVCGKTNLKAESYYQTVNLTLKEQCFWRIRAEPTKNHIVSMNVSVISVLPNKTLNCQQMNFFEIRYGRDKSVSGAIICGNVTNLEIKSEDHQVYIHNNHLRPDFYVELKFKKEKICRDKKGKIVECKPKECKKPKKSKKPKKPKKPIKVKKPIEVKKPKKIKQPKKCKNKGKHKHRYHHIRINIRH